MPKWVKVLLIVVGTLFVVLVVAGFVGAMALKSTVEDVQREARMATVDGEVFGMTSTTEECVEEMVNRSAVCEGFSPTCAPPLSAFLWACVEEATYQPSFCTGMPPLTQENAMMEWGQETCAKYGQPSNPMCALAVATITGYCESRKQMR